MLHPIGDSGPIIYGTNPMGHPCVKKDALSGCRFTGINMSNDADVSIPFERERACHNIAHLLMFANRQLHAVMREGAIGIGHFVSFAFADGGTFVFVCIH